jgi:hypothetical protein
LSVEANDTAYAAQPVNLLIEESSTHGTTDTH